jgi:hypothetical protein
MGSISILSNRTGWSRWRSNWLVIPWDRAISDKRLHKRVQFGNDTIFVISSTCRDPEFRHLTSPCWCVARWYGLQPPGLAQIACSPHTATYREVGIRFSRKNPSHTFWSQANDANP